MNTETTEQGAAAAPPPPEPMLSLATARRIVELLDREDADAAVEDAAEASQLAWGGPKSLYDAIRKLEYVLDDDDGEDEVAICEDCGEPCPYCTAGHETRDPASVAKLLGRARTLAANELHRVELSLYRPRGAVAEA